MTWKHAVTVSAVNRSVIETRILEKQTRMYPVFLCDMSLQNLHHLEFYYKILMGEHLGISIDRRGDSPRGSDQTSARLEDLVGDVVVDAEIAGKVEDREAVAYL